MVGSRWVDYWWRQSLRFWNKLARAPHGSFHTKTVLLDNLQDSVRFRVRNFSRSEPCTCNHAVSMVSHACSMIWHSNLYNHTEKCKHAGHYIRLKLYESTLLFCVQLHRLTPKRVDDQRRRRCKLTATQVQQGEQGVSFRESRQGRQVC